MKTPITYYGGKQTMLKHILHLIPEHRLYTEAFCGGAAVFFAKNPSDGEVINDLNQQMGGGTDPVRLIKEGRSDGYRTPLVLCRKCNASFLPSVGCWCTLRLRCAARFVLRIIVAVGEAVAAEGREGHDLV